MTFYPLPTISIRIVFVYVSGNAYILESDIDIVRCCGLISGWTFYPINKGSLKFVVWRSIGVDGYREVVGTNSVNVSGKNIQNSYHGYKEVVALNLSMYQVRSYKLVTMVTERWSALTLSMCRVKSYNLVTTVTERS